MEDLILEDVGRPRSGGGDVVEELANLVEEIGAARSRKRRESVEPAHKGQSKKSRREGRSGGSSSLAGITQALEGAGEA